MTCGAGGGCASSNCQVRLPRSVYLFYQEQAVNDECGHRAGPQDSEAAISFANWDVFWYTREFPSMDTERSRRHASKILTYPITIGSVLHQFSNLTLSNQRLTPEGSRSLAGTFRYIDGRDSALMKAPCSSPDQSACPAWRTGDS